MKTDSMEKINALNSNVQRNVKDPSDDITVIGGTHNYTIVYGEEVKMTAYRLKKLLENRVSLVHTVFNVFGPLQPNSRAFLWDQLLSTYAHFQLLHNQKEDFTVHQIDIYDDVNYSLCQNCLRIPKTEIQLPKVLLMVPKLAKERSLKVKP